MHVDELVTDSIGNLWMCLGGFWGGLYKFDGSSWTNYITSNSAIPDNNVYTIAIDRNNNLWTTYSGGLARFDGSTWTKYDASSGYPGTGGGMIVVDRYNNKWNTSGVGVIVFNENGIVSVNESQQKAMLSIYPNPSSDHILVQLSNIESQNAFMTVSNVFGQIVQQFQLSSMHQELDVSHLSQGIYFLQFQTKDGLISKKFIKQ